MSSENPSLEPIKSKYRVQFLNEDQLDGLQEATLQVLEEVGVKFPYDQALAIMADHGAKVDFESQIVKIPRDLVLKAMASVPRNFVMGARDASYDLHLEAGTSYFTNDGCGHLTVDINTGQKRDSTKADVAMMARISDYLSSIGFYWPTVSAQDCGPTSPLHELDATWNNSVKHVQSVTMLGKELAQYGVEMATVVRGSKEEIRHRPPLSLTICSIAPLMQDKEGLESALVLAEAGIPVTFLSMPTLGTTAPATTAGALVIGDAEVISATVLMQLASPGAPVCHSIMRGWADPRSAAYVGYPLDAGTPYAPVEMAHHWGMPAFGAAFGTDSKELYTWQSAAEVALDPLLVGLSGAEIVTGLGLRDTYTTLYPEAIILDDELYQRARNALMEMEVSPETLAVDVIAKVGPGGHFLSQKHTRVHMRHSLKRALAQQLDAESKYRDPLEVARERVTWILENHKPEPLDKYVQDELTRILDVAGREVD